MRKPMWDHPLACGHKTRLDHPKPNRRVSWYCSACQAMRKLAGGTPDYIPGDSDA